VLNSKGLAYNELGRHDDAISHYDQTLSIEKNNVTALLNKAVTLSFLLKFEDAIKFYDLAQQQENQSRAAMAKSEAYHKLGKEDEAFLAAQGLLVSDIERHVIEARAKKMKIFDYYCMIEYEYLEKREQEHQQKIDSKKN
jgi:tetratricopeptide (TPR) repeat protein